MNLKKKKKQEKTASATNPGLPVEQIATSGKQPSKKEVKEAIKEINPDVNSLGQRG